MVEENCTNTLTFALPARCEEATTASEKWLLALWQASSKRTWSLFFDRALISLEYRVRRSIVSYQAHFDRTLFVEVSRALLPGLFPGIDCTDGTDEQFGVDGGTRPGAVTAFRLRTPGWVELSKDVEPRGVGGIIEVLSHLEEDEDAIIQLLLSPTWMTTEDGKQPAFWFAGRIATTSTSERAAQRHARLLASAFGQFAWFNGLRFSSPRRMTRADVVAINDRRWTRRLLPPASPMMPSQIARLYHPPEDARRHQQLHLVSCLRTPTTSTRGVPVGEGRDIHGRAVHVGLNPRDLSRHAVVVGPSGTGKTTFLANLARELVRAGHGVTVIDPHGALVRQIARTLPSERETDGAMISFSDINYPIALNPLRVKRGMEFVAADELVEVVERVYGREYWGPLLDLMLRHAAMAAIELGGSLIESARLLDDGYYREHALTRIENPETVRILGQLASGFDRRMLPAINRLQRLLGTPWLRNIVGQTGRGLDFAEIFDRKAISLFDLSGVGTTNAKLLGSLLLLLIRQSTLGRSADDEGSARHFVLVDEASWFVSRTIAELYDQARKFGVGIVLAVQRVSQLAPEDTREAVLSNAGSILTFRISDRDEAMFLARRLASERIDASDLQHLPRHEAYLQLTRDGERLEPAWLQTMAPQAEAARAAEVEARLLAQARTRYARPRAVVEAELRLRDRLTLDDEEPEIRNLPLARDAVLAHAA